MYSQGVANVRKVFVDTETGANYLLASSNMTGGCGMCALLDADGKPVVTRLSEDDVVMMGPAAQPRVGERCKPPVARRRSILHRIESATAGAPHVQAPSLHQCLFYLFYMY